MRSPVCAKTALILVLAISSFSCGESDPTSPPPTFSISGSVRLTGDSTDATGAVVGPVRVEDANGVNVTLRRFTSPTHAQDVQSAQTLNGSYSFVNLPPGVYQVVTNLAPSIGDSTDAIVLGNNTTVADTLELSSSAGLVAYPNPFGVTQVLQYTIASSTPVALSIVDLGLSPVRQLVNETQGPNTYSVVWDGKREDNSDAPPGIYWAILVTNAGESNRLLFKQ